MLSIYEPAYVYFMEISRATSGRQADPEENSNTTQKENEKSDPHN
jgi:hypothetical protein